MAENIKRGLKITTQQNMNIVNYLQMVKELNATDPKLKGKLNRCIQLITQTYEEAFKFHGPFTFFAVTDDGFTREMSSREVYSYSMCSLISH